MGPRKRARIAKTGAKTGLIRQIRKPMAPPMRVEPDPKRYKRAIDRDTQRRETEESEPPGRQDKS